MATAVMIDSLIVQVLLPSWWEIKLSVSASLFVIAAYWFFTYGTTAAGDGDADRSLLEVSGDSVYAGSEVSHLKGDPHNNSACVKKYKKEVEAMLEVAHSFVKSNASSNKTDEAATSTTVAESSS